MYVHHDGYPSARLPLLLAAYQHRFGGDVDDLAAYLIDRVPVGWSSLGNDLLTGMPAHLRADLSVNWTSPGTQYADRPAGDPPVRITDADDTDGLDWGYILHPHAIEVVPLRHADVGPFVTWDTDPRSRFSDQQILWRFDRPVPATRSPRTARPHPRQHAAQRPPAPAHIADPPPCRAVPSLPAARPATPR
ncbi:MULTISPECIES: hypothetical protein [unclassified Streptomyces]|uniref:hypothetical protein n=1 Tax=unclassified Streptomyces TaxID=2593676 RepID=UPI0033D8A211